MVKVESHSCIKSWEILFVPTYRWFIGKTIHWCHNMHMGW